jgi:putative hydrolase of HD superfamily
MTRGLLEVLQFTCIIDDLKTRIRAGWLGWSVSAERLESVAEHCFSALILANSFYPLHPYSYKLNIAKVNMMLIFHEIGESIIGDVPVISKDHENKAELEHEAWRLLLRGLPYEDYVFDFLMEFDERETLEAKYAYHIDKIDAKKTMKRYWDQGDFPSLDECIKRGEMVRENPTIQELIATKGAKTALDIWFADEYAEYKDDPFFMEVHNLLRSMDTNIKPPELPKPNP